MSQIQVKVNDTLYTQTTYNNFIIGVKDKKCVFRTRHNKILTTDELLEFAKEVESGKLSLR